MKLALIGAACLAASALSGCAALKTDFNAGVAAVTSPATQTLIANVQTVATAISCDVSQGSPEGKALAAKLKTKQSAVGKLFVISADVCAKLSGTVTSTKPVSNVSAVTAVTAP